MPPAMQRRAGERGLTLIESTFSLLILAVLAVGVFTYLIDAQDTFTTQMSSSRVRSAEIEVFEVLETELSQASMSSLVIDKGADPNGDVVTYQVPLTVESDRIIVGAVRHGALSSEESDLREQRDAFVRIRVRAVPGGRLELVREVLDATEEVLEEVVLSREIDGSAAERGERVFEVDRNGPFLSVDLQLAVGRVGEEGTRAAGRVERTKRSFFRVRNF